MAAKVVTVEMPWAVEIAEGETGVAVRIFSTDYRGELFICACYP